MESKQLHKGNVMDMQLSKDGTHLITASQDMQAKLVDTESLEVLKTYAFERPCNSAAISPIYDHVCAPSVQPINVIFGLLGLIRQLH